MPFSVTRGRHKAVLHCLLADKNQKARLVEQLVGRETSTGGLTLRYSFSEPGLEVRASQGHEIATWGTPAGHDEAPVRLVAFD